MTKKQFKFKGVDNFSRPVFKAVDDKLYIGSVSIILPYKGFKVENLKGITEYFKQHPEELVFFGHKFNCEPDGRKLDFNKIEII